MERINDCNYARFQNAEHMRIHVSFNDLFKDVDHARLGIDKEYTTYSVALANEIDAGGYYRGSYYTNLIKEAWEKRENTISGIEDYMESCRNHFDSTIAQAGTTLYLVWKPFKKDLHSRIRNSKQGALDALLKKLTVDNKVEVEAAGMTGWVTQLVADHFECTTLENNRYNEQKSKTPLRMQTTRVAVDDAFEILKEKINAMALINGEADYQALIDGINIRIKNFLDNVSIRMGAKNSKDSETTDKSDAANTPAN